MMRSEKNLALSFVRKTLLTSKYSNSLLLRVKVVIVGGFALAHHKKNEYIHMLGHHVYVDQVTKVHI